MLVIIEHSGREDHNHVVKEMQDFIEDEFGFTTEQVIGPLDCPITMYDEDMKKIVEFKRPPEDELISYYLMDYLDKE
jgi:hypothetical protein